MSVTLRLWDVAADSLVWQKTEQGGPNPDSLNQLGLTAMSHVLPQLLDPGIEVDPATYEGRDLAAEALWMQGEQLYRRGQYSPAYELYHRAIQLDPTLSMAALRGAQAANWQNLDAEAAELVQLALEHVGVLPERYSDYANGLLSYLAGHADSAVAQLERALGADPEWSEVWMILGETYFHLLPGEGPRDSLAEAAFVAARLYDPGFTLPLFHLTEFSIWSGRVDEARERARAFAASDADSGRVKHLTLMLECVEAGPQPERWREVAEAYSNDVLQASASFARAGVHRRCAEHGFRAFIDSGTGTSVGNWDAMVGLTSVLAAEGRADAAAAVLDSAVASGFAWANMLYVFSAAAGGGLEQQASSFVSSLTAELYEETELNLWSRGVWAVHTRDAVETERLAEELSRRAAAPDAHRRVRTFAEAIDVHAALLAGDSTGALDRLERLRPRGERAPLYWSLWYGIGYERILLAELLLERGEQERAYRIAQEFDRSAPVPYQAYVPRSLVVRERAARSQGWTDLADRARDRLAELRRLDSRG
jgi:tetratricopeptide (TPR) repeat protein